VAGELHLATRRSAHAPGPVLGGTWRVVAAERQQLRMRPRPQGCGVYRCAATRNVHGGRVLDVASGCTRARWERLVGHDVNGAVEGVELRVRHPSLGWLWSTEIGEEKRAIHGGSR
jgi:hypothetical protein